MEFGRIRKKSPLLYYLKGMWRYVLTPRFVKYIQMRLCLHGWEQRADADIIRCRVKYYNRLNGSEILGPCTRPAGSIRLSDSHSRYWFDLMRYLRAFPKSMPIDFIDGDTGENPDFPSFCKARRLDSKINNGILLNMDSLRHFTAVTDLIPFEQKKDVLFFRGEIHGKPHRVHFFEMWAGKPGFSF